MNEADVHIMKLISIPESSENPWLQTIVMADDYELHVFELNLN